MTVPRVSVESGGWLRQALGAVWSTSQVVTGVSEPAAFVLEIPILLSERVRDFAINENEYLISVRARLQALNRAADGYLYFLKASFE